MATDVGRTFAVTTAMYSADYYTAFRPQFERKMNMYQAAVYAAKVARAYFENPEMLHQSLEVHDGGATVLRYTCARPMRLRSNPIERHEMSCYIWSYGDYPLPEHQYIAAAIRNELTAAWEAELVRRNQR